MGGSSEQLFQKDEYPSPGLSEDDLEDLQEELKPFRGTVSPREVRPTLVQEIKHKYYRNFTVGVGGGAPGFTDEPLGLRDSGIVADEMTIVTFPAGKTGISYKLNKSSNSSTPILAAGQEEDQFEIEEIYVTDDGSAPAGNLIIRVIWNPYLIRLTPS